MKNIQNYLNSNLKIVHGCAPAQFGQLLVKRMNLQQLAESSAARWSPLATSWTDNSILSVSLAGMIMFCRVGSK
jgi:hypothetical protein